MQLWEMRCIYKSLLSPRYHKSVPPTFKTCQWIIGRLGFSIISAQCFFSSFLRLYPSVTCQWYIIMYEYWHGWYHALVDIMYHYWYNNLRSHGHFFCGISTENGMRKETVTIMADSSEPVHFMWSTSMLLCYWIVIIYLHIHNDLVTSTSMFEDLANWVGPTNSVVVQNSHLQVNLPNTIFNCLEYNLTFRNDISSTTNTKDSL